MSNKTPNYWAIVPAAGCGSRMGNRCPKQYLHLLGKPILQHTLERLCLSRVAGIVVCLAEEDAYWETLTLPRSIIRVDGGKERCHSVLNGLQMLRQLAQPDDWVLVHDAARPCVRQADIEKLMTQLAVHSVGGLLAVPVRDTMKRAVLNVSNPHQGEIENVSNPHQGEIEIVETINRDSLWHALTPQMFRLETLYNALQSVLSTGELVTDDAQAIERLGLRPVLIEGHIDNIKVTHPQDLSLAELYLQQLEL